MKDRTWKLIQTVAESVLGERKKNMKPTNTAFKKSFCYARIAELQTPLFWVSFLYSFVAVSVVKTSIEKFKYLDLTKKREICIFISLLKSSFVLPRTGMFRVLDRGTLPVAECR